MKKMDLFSGINRSTARLFYRAAFFLILISLSGCQVYSALNQQKRATLIPFSVTVRKTQVDGSCPNGYTVKQALDGLNISYAKDDIINPDLDSPVQAGMTIQIIVVTSEEVAVEQIIPFESQTVRNEALPEGETFIIQTGKNGRKSIVTRKTYEDGQLVSQIISKQSVLEESAPEILMLGAKAEYAPIQVAGKIIYISNGNAWMMEGTTENRAPLITSGDMDGRILDLSENKKWLLFSRRSKNDAINSLWMLNTEDWNAEPVSLRISNAVHFAAWLPGDTLRIIYSTVTPTETAPGWKAENNLFLKIVTDSGMLLSDEELIAANEEGIYHWWGTEFHLAPDGRMLAAATADSISLVDRLTGQLKPLVPVLPYEKTRSDWAWVPGIDWTPDGKKFIFSYHGDISGLTQTYDPSAFHLGIYSLEDESAAPFQKETGLFSYPSVSPQFADNPVCVAYLKTLTPLQSESSRYQLRMRGVNGEGDQVVYPPGNEGYISPQKVVWAPAKETKDAWIAFLRQGNLWIINPFTGIYNQITNDQTISRFIWE